MTGLIRNIWLTAYDLLLAAITYPAAHLLKSLRESDFHNRPLCKKMLIRVGVFPIINHYYEPLFDTGLLRHPLSEIRHLPGIKWNVDEQLKLLGSFSFNEELVAIPRIKSDDLTFHMGNSAFGSGDAEYLYNLIRLKKPRKIIEIGSGNSTLIAIMAVKRNREEDGNYICDHVCIEPYEMPWLEKTGVSVLRARVEDVDKAVFAGLASGDLLFIDSSHIIRPQGDVLFEYLEVLPSLQNGVVVHIHDIFSPRDYPTDWVVEKVKFWNEQYLLEAFLSSTNEWKIIGALNYLRHTHYEQLQAKCPFLTPDREPGSFYIEKIG